MMGTGNLLHNNPTILLALVIVAVCLCIVIMIIFVLSKIESDKKITQTALEMNRITNSIHAGLVHFMLDDNYSICYASGGFFDLLGYSKDEAKDKQKCSITNFIHPRDREFFIEATGDSQKATINFEIRLVKKNASIIYCIMNGNFVNMKNKGQSISAVFVDITEQKKMQETLRVDRERYRIASELSNDILFEYMVDSDKMVYTDKYFELFGREPILNDYVKNVYIYRDLIHPNDFGVFVKYCNKLRAGEKFIAAEVRIKNCYNNYIWCQLMGKTIYDEEGRPDRVLGKMVNIDYYKRELDALEFKASRDPLTGVYNREVTVKKIDKFIKENMDGKHLFMFFDFDDFKKVNDSYGHLVGDRVLIYVIDRIRSIFGEDEIIGRIGGDEFVIFFANVEDDESIKLKAESLIKALDTSYISDGSIIPISGSVGIASYPDHGLNCEQLMLSADKALYYVKSKGKNDYILYKDII